MTPEMFERLIKILSEPDIKGYIIQIFTAALPICYAMWISKKDKRVDLWQLNQRKEFLGFLNYWNKARRA